MTTTCPCPASSRDNSRHPDTTRDDYARAAVYAEFKFKHAVGLDQADFIDRKPDEQPRPAPEAWQRETGKPKWPGLVRRTAA